MKKVIGLLLSLSLIICLIGVLPVNSYSASNQNTVTDYSDVFDSNYYANTNPDVKAAFGNDSAKLLYHFITCGMDEGRQGNEDFNVYVYMNRYPELQKKYGKNLKSYYIHYITSGKKEGKSGRADGKAPTGNTSTKQVPTTPSKLTGGNKMDLTKLAAYNSANQMISGDIFAQYDVTMVNCFTTWCGYCIREMPDIQKLYSSLPSNVNIIGICFDANDSPSELSYIINSNNLKFTVLKGDSYSGVPFSTSGLISGWPTTFFVNSKGQIINTVVGAPRNPVSYYKSEINKCLKSMGKKTF